MSYIRKYINPNEQANHYIKLFLKYAKGKNFIHRLIKIYYRMKLFKGYNIIIGESTVIGNNVRFPHPMNIVLGMGAKIGDNCTIYHNVTLGQNRDGYPIIGNNVIIYPSVTIIGSVVIGDNVVIGCGSIVTKDISSNNIVGGNPCKILKKRCETDEFY